MIDTLKCIDKHLFLLLNSLHTTPLDTIMYWISNEFIWTPFYIFLLYLIYKKLGKQTLTAAVLIVLMITLSDQLSVHLFKNVFLRYRPCHNINIQNMVHLVNGYCGGLYGFISSHAANTFALSVFLIVVLKGYYTHFSWLILVWAAIVSYSRIYLGVHYPADVFCGALFGTLLGYLIGKLFFIIQKQQSTNHSRQ